MNYLLFVENLPPVPALPPPSSPEASQIYETPVAFDPLRLRTSKNSVKYESPAGIKGVRVSADSNQYDIYSSIDDEDPNAEEYCNMQSIEIENEYDRPYGLRRGDCGVHKYQTFGDSRRGNPCDDLDSNGYLVMRDLNQK